MCANTELIRHTKHTIERACSPAQRSEWPRVLSNSVLYAERASSAPIKVLLILNFSHKTLDKLVKMNLSLVETRLLVRLFYRFRLCLTKRGRGFPIYRAAQKPMRRVQSPIKRLSLTRQAII